MLKKKTVITLSSEVHGLDGDQRYRKFLAEFRESDVCSLPCADVLEPDELHRALLDALLEIGSLGIAEGVAVTMHLYMLSAIATMPSNDITFQARRRAYLDMVREQRLLVANTGSDSTSRSDNSTVSATRAIPVSGGYRVEGEKTFVSMATVADLVLFNAITPDNRRGFFIASLKAPGVEVCRPHFDENFPMQTHHVRFTDVFIPAEMALPSHGDASFNDIAHGYQRAWFQSLIAAVYLGAAKRAMNEAACFATSTFIQGGQRLSELDGTLVDLGRLQNEWHTALAASSVCGARIKAFTNDPSETTLEELQIASIVAKTSGCRASESIVRSVRQFIGTRSLESRHPLSEISRLISFGPLHPVLSAHADRALGHKLFSSQHLAG